MYNEEQENYYQRMLSNSISSMYPSEEAKKRARRKSPLYFDDLKEKLLVKYGGKKVTDIKNSEIISTDYGETLKITTKEKINFNIVDNDFKNQMNHNLKLLTKIGLKKEQNLKNQGYDTIESLKKHDTYCNVASKFLDSIEDMSFQDVMNLLDRNKYSRKC